MRHVPEIDRRVGQVAGLTEARQRVSQLTNIAAIFRNEQVQHLLVAVQLQLRTKSIRIVASQGRRPAEK